MGAAPAVEVVLNYCIRHLAEDGIPARAVSLVISDDEIGRHREIGARVNFFHQVDAIDHRGTVDVADLHEFVPDLIL